MFGSALYDEAHREQLPDTAVKASLGCGVPTAVADLHPGEVVLDLGSGAGADVLISARRVGPTGRAIGLDMTDEMLELARANAVDAGVENVEFVKGYLEDMPLDDETVDVVISNCVINLSGDKPRVIHEAARVLRPGGRFAVSDVIADPNMDEQTTRRHSGVDRLHRRRADRGRVPEHTRGAPASARSRLPRPTGCTSTPAQQSSAPASSHHDCSPRPPDDPAAEALDLARVAEIYNIGFTGG